MNPLMMLAMMLVSSMMMMIVGMSAASALSADPTDDGKSHEDPTACMQREVSTSGMISEIHGATTGGFFGQQNDTDHTMKSHRKIKPGRRLKRTIADHVAISNSFILIGIVMSVTNPAAGAIPLIIGTLIPLFFPGGEPVRSVWAERAESHRLKMIGFMDTMQHIAQLHATDVEECKADLRTLYYTLNNDGLTFMKSDNVKSSAAYFKEFAKLHLAVNELLIFAYQSQPLQVRFWRNNLYNNIQKYIAYASYAVQQEYEDTTIRNDLEPSIASWTLLLTSASQEELKNRRLVFYDKPVAFRITPKKSSSDKNKWLSCWNAHLGEKCTLRECPCDDNPMERGPGSDLYGDDNAWKCRGEIFWIEPIDPNTDDIVRTCDRVGIFYMRKWGSYRYGWFWSRRHEGNYWWLSMYETALPCPSAHIISRFDVCPNEVWRIKGKGKPCNVPIIDHDDIQLVNEEQGYTYTMFTEQTCQSYCSHAYCPSSCSYSYLPHFVIFKADVSQADYYRYLPSLRRPENQC